VTLDESSDQEDQRSDREQPDLPFQVVENEARVERVSDLEHRDQLEGASYIEGHASH